MLIRQLIRSTSALGVHNVILSLDRHPSLVTKTPEATIYQAKEDFNVASTGFSVQSISMLAKLSREVDIVHYHFPWPFMDLAHFAARVRTPSVVTYHSDIIRQRYLLQVYKPLMHAFLGRVDAVVATSPNYLQSSPVLDRYAHKVSVIPIGLDETSYPSASPPAVDAWKTKFGERFYLFVGVLRYYKGLHVLLDAVAGTGIPLVIVGAGPVERELLEQAQRLGLQNVHFIGEVSEQVKVDLMQACYAVVFPSHLRSEAFGVSLLEGAMFSKPLVCSEIGTGTSYVNAHGVTGIVVPPADSTSLREALLHLWDNPDQAAIFGKAARQRYEQLFTADRMAQSHLTLYRHVLSRATGSDQDV